MATLTDLAAGAYVLGASLCLLGVGGTSTEAMPMARTNRPPEIRLSQSEADALFVMEKHRLDDARYSLPGGAGRVVVELASPDGRERFLLDVRRARIDVDKGTYGNRARKSFVLASLHFGNRPHTNPVCPFRYSGQELTGPHIHTYRAGYGLKYAEPLDPQDFPNITNRRELLISFMRLVNITKAPFFDPGLFDG